MSPALRVLDIYESMCARSHLFNASNWLHIGQRLFDTAFALEGDSAQKLTDRAADCTARALRCDQRARGVALGAGWRSS